VLTNQLCKGIHSRVMKCVDGILGGVLHSCCKMVVVKCCKTNHVCINCYSCQCVHVNTTACSDSLYVYKLTIVSGILGVSSIQVPEGTHLHAIKRVLGGVLH